MIKDNPATVPVIVIRTKDHINMANQFIFFIIKIYVLIEQLARVVLSE